MRMGLIDRADLTYQCIVFELMWIGLEILGKVHTTLDQHIVEHGHESGNMAGGLVGLIGSWCSGQPIINFSHMYIKTHIYRGV